MTTDAAHAEISSPQPARALSLRMSARDLINVGIFAALYSVTVLMFSMVGVISPVVMLFALALGVIAAGVPFVLFLTRVRHGGMVLLFCVIFGGVYQLMGQPTVSFFVTLFAGSLVEIVLYAGRYASKRSLVLANAAMSLWFIGPWLPLFYAREDFFAEANVEAMGEDYIAAMDDLLSTELMLGYAACAVLLGLIGGAVGVRMLRRHFERAGLA